MRCLLSFFFFQMTPTQIFYCVMTVNDMVPCFGKKTTISAFYMKSKLLQTADNVYTLIDWLYCDKKKRIKKEAGWFWWPVFFSSGIQIKFYYETKVKVIRSLLIYNMCNFDKLNLRRFIFLGQQNKLKTQHW